MKLHMKMKFESTKIEEKYNDPKYIKRKYGDLFERKLEDMLSFIEASECAYDIKCMPQYQMHMLHGKLHGVYSLSPDNKKSKWRVPALCLDEEDCVKVPSEALSEIKLLKETKKFLIKEIGDYHD